MGKETMKEKVVLIIGAGRWPGPLLSLAFAGQGATVAVNDLSPILLDPICNSAGKLPGQIKAYVADATRGMPLRAMLDEVLQDWGRIDVLVNNPRVQPDVDLIDMDEWDWQRTIEMNLNGPFLVSQLVANSMHEQGHGIILNIVDTTDAIFEKGYSAYAASQAGLLALSQAAARELMTYNIVVHTLCPDREVLHNPFSIYDTQDRDSNINISDEVLVKLALSLICNAERSQMGQTYIINKTSYKLLPNFDLQE